MDIASTSMRGSGTRCSCGQIPIEQWRAFDNVRGPHSALDGRLPTLETVIAMGQKPVRFYILISAEQVGTGASIRTTADA